MKPKAKIMDTVAVSRALARISHEIVERNQGLGDVILLGVKRRGLPLARMLADNMQRFWGAEVPVGELDVTARRDDISEDEKRLKAGKSVLPCDINGKTVIVVDDVLYTGRTARAAIETVFSFGRPKQLQLVVLVDRGHRELPLRPDYVGKNVPTSQSEKILFDADESGSQMSVFICDID